MYTRDHGKAHMKNTTFCWLKAVKRSKVKALRAADKKAVRQTE